MELSEQVMCYVADRVDELLNKHRKELNSVYETGKKLNVAFSVEIKDKGGVPKVKVKIKSKIEELEDKTEGLAIDKQTKLDMGVPK